MKRIVWLLACFALASAAIGDAATAASFAEAAAGSSSPPSTTAAGAVGGTCANQNPGTAVPAVPRLANPKTARHTKYRFSFDYPSSWFDGTDMSEVTAGGVLDETTLRAARIKPTDTLHNVNVSSKTGYPALTVYRFAAVKDTAAAVATRMAAFLHARGVSTGPLQSWCLDGAPARGFLTLASSGTFQQSWFTIHGGALYYVFFLGKTDGTQRAQDDLVLSFASIRATWKWL